jgi:hypothetical protein
LEIKRGGGEREVGGDEWSLIRKGRRTDARSSLVPAFWVIIINRHSSSFAHFIQTPLIKKMHGGKVWNGREGSCLLCEEQKRRERTVDASYHASGQDEELAYYFSWHIVIL